MRYGAVQERQANEDLAVALSAYKDGRWREAAVDLREVAERWDGRGVALVAQFYAAQADLEAGDLEAAGSAFEALSAQGGAPAYLRQQALVGLGYIAAEGDDDAGAARRYADAVAVGGPYTGPALLGEARARLALGEVDAAKALYERFLGEFPESPERAAVEQEVAGL